MIIFYRYKNPKKLKLISGKKDGYFCGKTWNFKAPPMSSKKNTEQEYSKKNYIYTEDKKDGYSQGKSKKFKAPHPNSVKNIYE